MESLFPFSLIDLDPSFKCELQDYSIFVYTGSSYKDSLEKLTYPISQINSLAFGLDETTTEETKERLAKTDTLLLAIVNEAVVGFATFQIIGLDGGVAIYQSRGILPSHHGRGLGKSFTRTACELHSPDILVAKAQNPVSIWATMRSRVLKTIYPIEKLYSESPEMQQSLRIIVERRGHAGEVDLSTGLHRKSYPMGRLGNYQINLSHPGIALVEQRLQEIGLKREEGDAVYYMGKVKTL